MYAGRRAEGRRGDAITPKVSRSTLGGIRRAGGSGTMADVLHPRARFYAGGMQSVRGFAENELGPQVLQARARRCSPPLYERNDRHRGSIHRASRRTNSSAASAAAASSKGAELRVPRLKAPAAGSFLDGAYVGAVDLVTATKGRTAITPGAGFRYRSPLGVLRMDFGLRPVGARSLPVVVAVVDAQGNERIVTLGPEKRYSPVDDSPSWRHSIARRIVVHFAMGQAF